MGLAEVKDWVFAHPVPRAGPPALAPLAPVTKPT